MKLRRGRLVSNHFKRKNDRGNTLSQLLILGMIALLMYFVIDIVTTRIIKANELAKKDFKYEETVEQIEAKIIEEERLKAEANITQAILEIKASKAERFISEINNEIEYITLSECGTYKINHSRLESDAGWWKKTFKESNIEVNFDYVAIFSISTKDIDMYMNSGAVYIDYDPNIIDVRSIEVSNITTKSSKDWFGKKYSNQEVLALVEIAKEEIYEQLNNDTTLKAKSCENLNNYFTSIANKIELDELFINNEAIIEKKYNFIDLGTIRYNHPNEALDDVFYIVIHSTACKDVTALQFYNNLNTYKQKRSASAHYFIDDENVVEAIGTNLVAWHCGTEKPKIPCTNYNSLGIEICEFTNEDKQQKAIENTVSFVNEVLLKEFPNAKIVMHRDIKPTLCPSILSDAEFERLFRSN